MCPLDESSSYRVHDVTQAQSSSNRLRAAVFLSTRGICDNATTCPSETAGRRANNERDGERQRENRQLANESERAVRCRALPSYWKFFAAIARDTSTPHIRACTAKHHRRETGQRRVKKWRRTRRRTNAAESIDGAGRRRTRRTQR